MEFTFQYRGELKANGNPQHKHELRRHFHIQLAELWRQLPLSNRPHLQTENPPPGKISLLQQVGSFKFVPLVSSKIHAVAELSITILRPGPPGAIVSQGGDIDNRLKTLLDSLKIPESNALPPGVRPSSGEDPFYCLLEDDRLVTKLSVSTDRLLDAKSSSEVVLLTHVTTKHVETIFANIGL
jgi:hypothetical protein